MTRNDIHSPSQIIPSDYEYVAQTYFGGMGIHVDINSIPFVIAERKKLNDHMTRTGGHYSQHEHGGTCHCCGASAIYMFAFYHAKTNEYIKVGQICAEKMELSFDEGDANLFRKNIREALKIAKGKKRAAEILEGFGLSRALDIKKQVNESKTFVPYEEATIADMTGKLIRYGNLSNKQVAFMQSLIQKIDNRAALTQKREEEKANAAPCPNGRVKFTGQVINVKIQDGMWWGPQLKILVKSETGFLAFGSVAKSLGDVNRGDKIEFMATFTPSDKDEKFGYFKRPTQASFSKGTLDNLTELEKITENMAFTE